MTKTKNIAYTVLALFLASVFLGCVAKEPEPKADGKALYTFITKDKDYKKWKMWPGKSEMYPGKEPHGAFLTTYVTDDAYSAIAGKKGSLPDASIIVKENYMPDKTLAALTVMYREKGYDPEHNDWFWAKYSPSGEIQAEGKVKGCNDCHGQRKDNDFIWTSDIK